MILIFLATRFHVTVLVFIDDAADLVLVEG